MFRPNYQLTIEVKDSTDTFIPIFGGWVSDINIGVQNAGAAAVVTNATVTAIGALGGYQAATGANTLANIPVADLIARWRAGDRSPEIAQALMQAGVSTAQIGTGTAAMLPAMGPKTAKIKGAGTIGTLGLGAYNAYKALTEE